MLARRLTYAACALILIAAIGAAISRRHTQAGQAVAPPLTAPALPAPEVTAQLPPDSVVRARLGDIVSLAVRSTAPDTATITAFGVSALTSSEVPGTLLFVADQAGHYPVLLEDSGRLAGTVVVSDGA